MTQQKLNYIFMALLLVAVLVAGWFGVTLPVTPEIPAPLPVNLTPLEQRVEALESMALSQAVNTDFRAPNVPCYQAVGGRSWVAEDGCAWIVDGGQFRLTGEVYTLTGARTLTVTTSSYVVSATAVTTLTLAGGAPGDMVFLTNITTNNVVIVDTGATAGGSSRTLGKDDVIGFIYNGGKWLESFYSDNS
ncbi:MAG TPA: hypothetical protein PKZ84_10160 [Anaerolineae bacterium]|nr:hypothetical protein [Anaerolineae bacterium]HQI85002.1 hypothetical protein [Anaerolineae bacterium]